MLNTVVYLLSSQVRGGMGAWGHVHPLPIGHAHLLLIGAVARLLLPSQMLITTFAVNYTGRPFMESLRKNRGMVATLLIATVLIVGVVGGRATHSATHSATHAAPTDLRAFRAGGSTEAAGLRVLRRWVAASRTWERTSS